MSFWDTEPAKPQFVFEDEKKKLIDNMDYLMQMSVEEQTLYKKWVELQEDSMLRDKSTIASSYRSIAFLLFDFTLLNTTNPCFSFL